MDRAILGLMAVLLPATALFYIIGLIFTLKLKLTLLTRFAGFFAAWLIAMIAALLLADRPTVHSAAQNSVLVALIGSVAGLAIICFAGRRKGNEPSKAGKPVFSPEDSEGETLREWVDSLPPGGTFKVNIPPHLKDEERPSSQQAALYLDEAEQAGLSLWQVLAYLVEDWREKEQAGMTPMRLKINEVFEIVSEGGNAFMGYHAGLKPMQVAELIEMDLKEVGSHDFARRRAQQYKTKQELLEDTDFHDFLSEV